MKPGGHKARNKEAKKLVRQLETLATVLPVLVDEESRAKCADKSHQIAQRLLAVLDPVGAAHSHE